MDELQYWNGFTGPDGNITEPLIKEFESKTSLRVEVQKMPWGAYFDKLISAIAAGDPPDVFVLHHSELASYAAMGALLPLDDLVEGNPAFPPKEDRVAGIWDMCVYEGKRYGIPIDTHLLGLYYNKDLFDAAGLPYPSAMEPLGAAAFLDLAQRLTIRAPGNDQPASWGFTFSGAPFRNFTSMLWQFGGDLLDPNMKTVTINSPEGQQALDWMCDLVVKYRVAPQPEGLDTWQFFLQGKVAMFTEGCWVLNGLTNNAKFRWGVAPFPRIGPNPGVWATGHVLCVSKNLPRDRRENAMRLIAYLNQTGVEWSKSGMIPTRHSQLDSVEFKRDTRMAPFVAQLEHVRFEPSSPAGIELRDRYEAAIINALTGQATPEKALMDAENRMRRVLRGWE